MEYTQKQVLEMVVSWNHAGKVLKIGCKFLKLNDVIRFNVIPAPYEFIESLFLCLFVSEHFRMSLGVIYLTHLLESDFLPCYFINSLISIYDGFITVLV
jgi:hypothetical protein